MARSAPGRRHDRRQRGSTGARTLGAVAALAGVVLIAFSIARAVATPSATLTAPSDAAYRENVACARCPAGVALRGVELQTRGAATLFIVRGSWPSSTSLLRVGVKLDAGTVVVELVPRTQGGGLVVARATDRGVAFALSAIGVGIQGDALLINVARAMPEPVTVVVGLWDGARYLARLPALGTLRWTGEGAPVAVPPVVAVVPHVPAPTGPDATAFAGACTAIPTGTVPQFLTLRSVRALPPARDPRTGVSARRAEANVDASALGVRVPYVAIAVISPAGGDVKRDAVRPIDGIGTSQLLLSSDGSLKHKAVRTFANGRWTTRADAQADDLTYIVDAHAITFSWTGLKAGDRLAFVTAAATGCSISH